MNKHLFPNPELLITMPASGTLPKTLTDERRTGMNDTAEPVMLTVALARPGRVLSPNSRSHWTAKQRVVREARTRARLLMLRSKRDAEALCLLPEGWKPNRYDVTWFFWGGTGPDADNALASCKAYLDGCCDALGVNDRVLDCAGIHRIKDREQDGTVLIRFMAD